MTDLTNPIFHDEDKARAFFEDQRWPDGAVCPFCNEQKTVAPLHGESMGPGWYHCKACREKFTVRVGTVMERSHVPLHKWALAFRIMAASKKGCSALQLHRMLGTGSYRTAWFMCHRIREAMRDTTPSDACPMGGHGKTLESDETYVGGKAKNAHKSKPIPQKHAVHALVERGGEVRAKHIANVTAKTLRDTIKEAKADMRSVLNTDAASANVAPGQDFADYAMVNHAAGEYVKDGGETHTQSVESFFALLKRGVYGNFHAVSKQHLQRYVDEAAFKWNNRIKLGIDDTARTNAAVKGAAGKRLTYRRPDQAEAT